MEEWIYCHKCYAPDGAKIGLPEPDQEVVLSYIDREGNKDICLSEYCEEDELYTKEDDRDIFPDEGIVFKRRAFPVGEYGETAVIPYSEIHIYYEQHGHDNAFDYIGYAWKPIEEPAPTILNGFPNYL